MGAYSKNQFFCSILLQICYFFAFFQLFTTKNTKNYYFKQRVGCAAPKGWLKYTTPPLVTHNKLVIFFSETNAQHATLFLSTTTFYNCTIELITFLVKFAKKYSRQLVSRSISKKNPNASLLVPRVLLVRYAV